MSWLEREKKSVYEIASQNLRNALTYLHRDLKMPREMLEAQVRGILTSFALEDVYEQERKRDEK